MNNAFSALRLSYIALGCALITVCAWVTVPAAVPFTMQTFAVFMTVCVLGGKDAALAILVYLFLGGVGIPVFSGFKGGPAALFGPTGGYLWGFLAIALSWQLSAKNGSALSQVLSLLGGLLVCYAVGTLWFAAFTSRSSPVSLSGALSLCVIPFILPDLAKLALALTVGRRVRKVIRTP